MIFILICTIERIFAVAEGSKIIKENKSIIIRSILSAIIGAAAIYADFQLKINNAALNELVTILFSTVTVVAGLWISCYLLFLQLYKDRYPIKALKNCYLPNMRNNFSLVIFCIIYGSIVIVFNNGIIANLYYCAVCICTVIEILVKIYQTNKSLMLTTYVDKVFKDIDNDLNESKNIIKEETFKNIKHILDESVVKEEYFIVQNISERLGEVYRSFLKNSIAFEGENANADDVEKSFERIINFNIYELKLCKNIKSEITIDKIISQQIKNIKFCIEKNQYEWFKKYIDSYNVFLFKTQKEDNSQLTEKLYSTYRDVLEKLIESDKNEWVEYLNKELEHVIHHLVFFYNDTGIRSYCSLVAYALISCVNSEKQNTECYDVLFESLCQFSSLISKTSGSFNKVKMCYSLLFNELLKCDYNKALIFYDKVLDFSFYNSEEPVLLEFKMYCISELISKSTSDETKDKSLLNKHIDVIVNVISLKEKYQGYLMIPNFKQLIKTNQYNIGEIKNIKDKMFILVNNCIVKDNLPMFYNLLNDYNNVILNTEQRQKEIQEELTDIYFSLIYRTRGLINKQYLEITFQMFENAIKTLDSKKLISSDLGEYIITNIGALAQHGDKDTHIAILKSIDLLDSFLDKKESLNFVLSDSKKKKLLFRTMFNIGTDCIENNYEEGLRKVSNSLGWFIINSIDNGNNELTNYLIERASELYKISKDMEISSKTLTFILTLFTTVGTYCCKNPAYTIYLKKLLKGISFENIEKIKTAISLRTSENDTWNKMFDNKTVELSNKFIYEFEKYKTQK